MRFQKVTSYILLFLICLGLDQALKNILPGIPNPGLLFGLVHDFTFYLLFLGIIFLVITVFTLKINLGTILLLAGVVSNLVDRLRFGHVLDYIDIKFLPVFNLADVFILIGVVFVITKLKKGM